MDTDFARMIAAALQPLVDKVTQLEARVAELERVGAMEWDPCDAEYRPAGPA